MQIINAVNRVVLIAGPPPFAPNLEAMKASDWAKVGWVEPLLLDGVEHGRTETQRRLLLAPTSIDRRTKHTLNKGN